MRNWSLKDEIREYWSMRAATFDLSPGHEIFGEDERTAWHHLIERHVGPGRGRAALDVASGTGVISRLLAERGFAVTGLDFSDQMLLRARGKSEGGPWNARFLSGDAENTMLPSDSFDALMTRHLVWTLPEPAAAFADWFRVLKPGGRILIVDVDMNARTAGARVLRRVAAILKRIRPTPQTPGRDPAVHDSILARVHFSKGAAAESVAALLRAAGFVEVVINRDLGRINRAQARHMPLATRLERASQDLYAISASKPLNQDDAGNGAAR